MIRNIIFDFGGVLIDWNPRYVYRDYFKTNEEMEQFLNEVCSVEWISDQDRGQSIKEGTEQLQKQFPQYSELISIFYDKSELMLKETIPGMEKVLSELKDAGYKIYGLTNWSAETIDIAYKKYPLFKYFDGIVVSGQEKMIKPDKRLYNKLLNRYALKAHECVFIDDNIVNIEAAENIGIKGILFKGASDLKKRLEDILTK